MKKIGKNGKTMIAVVGGVVASTSLFLSQGAVSSIDATKFSAIVVARDADGNAIVTDRYESANGHAGQNRAERGGERRYVVSLQSEQFLNRGQRAESDGKL